MGDWANLPLELLAHLFSFLSRRDRLSCSLVCCNWKDGLDHVLLWKTMVVYIDTDLTEPSTIMLLRNYCKYLKNLEFGWTVHHRNNKWTHVSKYKELVKRATRFFLILYDSYIQIHTLKIFNWFDVVAFQKVTYHLTRFLKNQMNLQHIIFDNINMQGANCIKLLTSCLGSKSTITSLDIRGCYYFTSSYDPVYFRSCIEQLSHLKSFKLDYFIFSRELIDSILTSKNRHLENLQILLNEASWHDSVVKDEKWKALCRACPNLKVNMTIRNVYHFTELSLYLKPSIPIVSLSLMLPRVLDRESNCHVRKTLNLIQKYYYTSLENIELHMRNDYEFIDDLLLTIIRRCTQLKRLLLNGYIDNLQVVKTVSNDTKFLEIASMGEPENLFVEVNPEKLKEMGRKRIQFSLQKHNGTIESQVHILN